MGTEYCPDWQPKPMPASSMISSFGDHVPPDKDQRLVVTPYGEAIVVRTSTRTYDGVQPVMIYEMQLTDWKRTEGSHSKPASLYTSILYPSVAPQVGHDVLCSFFGRGRVIRIRDDGMLEVRLSHWRLARRNRVTCYVAQEKVQVVRQKQIYEMTVAEKIEHGQTLKQDASKRFAAKDFNGALELYAKAVDAVRYVQHKPDSTNEMRADLLILMITCSNNAATCCLQTHQYENAINFACNALTLIDALEGKKGMKIHTILNGEGLSDVTLFGEYKIKSLLVLAKAHLEKKNTIEALQYLKQAHSICHECSSGNVQSKSLQAYAKEISKLYSICKEKRQEEKLIEKKRAKAMFGSRVTEDNNDTTKVTEMKACDEHPSEANNTEPSRNSASPTSVVDDRGQKEAEEASVKMLKPKKRVSFSSDVKATREDAEDAFYVGLGMVGVALVVGAAIGCTRFLLGKSKR